MTLTVLAHLKPHSLFKLPSLTQFAHLKPPKTPCSSNTEELNTEIEKGKHQQSFQIQE